MFSNIAIYCVNIHIRIVHPKLFLIARVAKSVFLGDDSSHSTGEISHTSKVCFFPVTAKGA